MSKDVNPIAKETRLADAPSTEWGINGAGDPTVQGFAHDISINRGEANHFKVNTDATDYRIDIYRLGYYASMAARLASASVGRAKTTC